MTINRARQLLGKRSTHLTDEEIEAHIEKLGLFADQLVDATLEHLATIKANEASNHLS